MPVTADGGVMKKLLKKSTAPHDFEKGDDNPDDLSHVKVHYRAYKRSCFTAGSDNTPLEHQLQDMQNLEVEFDTEAADELG